MIQGMFHLIRCCYISLWSSGRVGGGGKKHEIYVVALGGHFFYDLILQGCGEGTWPPRAPWIRYWPYIKTRSRARHTYCANFNKNVIHEVNIIGVENPATRTLECKLQIHQYLLNQSWLNIVCCISKHGYRSDDTKIYFIHYWLT